MRAVFFITYLGGLLTVASLLIMHQPSPKADLAGYSKCRLLHPERYCAITFLGAK